MCPARSVLHPQLYGGAAGAGLVHHHLPVDAVLERPHMGDDAHQPVALGQAGEHPDGKLQRFLVQRAEALINEHSIHPDAAALLLHGV